MTPARRRYTLTHEIGHALYGHRGDSDANEVETDRFAWSLIAEPFEAVARASREFAKRLYVRDRFMDAFEEWLSTPRLAGV